MAGILSTDPAAFPLEPEEVARLRAEHDLAFEIPPDEAAPAEAEREANRLLGALGSVRAQMAANQRLRDDEVSRADQWLARVNRQPKRAEFWILGMLEALSAFVPTFGKAKSRDLPRGVIGHRKKPERIVVEDPKAAVAWAKERGLPTEVEETVPHAVLKKAWQEGRAADKSFVPPGCTVIPAEETFFANPEGVA